MMEVGTVNASLMQLQSPSVAAGQTTKTAQTLQKKSTGQADVMEAFDHVIEAIESDRSLEMHYDKEIGRVVVQVIDGKTQKVVFQIPREGIVNLTKSFRNYLKAIKEGV